MNRIISARLVEIECGESPTAEDVELMIATARAYWTLRRALGELDGLATLCDSGGDEIELTESGIRNYLSNQAERAQEARDQDYYGGGEP